MLLSKDRSTIFKNLRWYFIAVTAFAIISLKLLGFQELNLYLVIPALLLIAVSNLAYSFSKSDERQKDEKTTRFSSNRNGVSEVLVVLDSLVYLAISFYCGGFTNLLFFIPIGYLIVVSYVMPLRVGFIRIAYFIAITTVLFFMELNEYHPLTTESGFYQIFSSEQARTKNILSQFFLLNFTFIAAVFIANKLGMATVEQQSSLRNSLSEATKLALTDGLTGLYNYRYFIERLEIEVKRARRYNQKLSLFVLDIDNFKQINDSIGHMEGSATLVELGNVMKETLRDTDIIAKYGGDEFCVILPQTDKKGAVIVADKIRRTVRKRSFESLTELSKSYVSVCIGIAVFPDDAADHKVLLKKADMAMYEAKDEGKDKVVAISNI